MRRWPRWVAALIVLAPALLAGSALPACACSCQMSTEAEYAQRADLIFEGVAVDADKPLLPGTGTSVSYTFVVESVVKGTAGDRAEMHTPADEGSCGFAFELGHRYRVYAASGLTTLCAGNRDLGAAPDVPVEDGLPLGLVVAGVAAIGVVLIVVVGRRRGRRRRTF